MEGRQQRGTLVHNDRPGLPVVSGERCDPPAAHGHPLRSRPEQQVDHVLDVLEVGEIVLADVGRAARRPAIAEVHGHARAAQG